MPVLHCLSSCMLNVLVSVQKKNTNDVSSFEISEIEKKYVLKESFE